MYNFASGDYFCRETFWWTFRFVDNGKNRKNRQNKSHENFVPHGNLNRCLLRGNLLKTNTRTLAPTGYFEPLKI